MKKINSYGILMAGVFALTACSTDNDSNPVYQQPDSFVLNTPAYATTVFDLANATIMTLTCTQPGYGFTAATTYSVQVSLNDTWQAETDDVPATFEELDTSSSKAQVNADAVELDKAIVKLSKWRSEEDFDGNDVDIFVRMKAEVSSTLPPVYSNSVKIKVLPYYIELTDAAPSFFFLIGNYVGGWDNGMKDIGKSLIPMSMVPDYEYNKKTGAGKFTYTEYFEAATKDNGFKLIGMINNAINWNEQWGHGEDGDLPGNANPVHLHNEGGNPGHLGVAESGWYTIEVNDNEEKKLTFKKLDTEPAKYNSIQLLGDFSGWEANELEMSHIGNTTHSWTVTVTIAEKGGVKFRANNDWGTNWGNKTGQFPFGIGDTGANIPVQPGTYIVTFNDIDGGYGFFIQE